MKARTEDRDTKKNSNVIVNARGPKPEISQNKFSTFNVIYKEFKHASKTLVSMHVLLFEIKRF